LRNKNLFLFPLLINECQKSSSNIIVCFNHKVSEQTNEGSPIIVIGILQSMPKINFKSKKKGERKENKNRCINIDEEKQNKNFKLKSEKERKTPEAQKKLKIQRTF